MRRLGSPLVSLSLAVALCACAESHPDYYGTIKPQHPPDIIWTNNGTEAEYIDPGKCSDSSGGTVILNAFAGLVQMHPSKAEPMPDIAHGWDISEDGTVYTFYLRRQNWSDGHPLTAHDFEYAWKRVLNPATASKYGTYFYALKHGAPYHQQALLVRGFGPDTTSADLAAHFGKIHNVREVVMAPELRGAFVYFLDSENIADMRAKAIAASHGQSALGGTLSVEITPSSVVGVKALNDLTLQVTLGNPIPHFLSMVMFYTAMPVPAHLLERLKAEGLHEDAWTRLEHIVTNGPYLITEWKFRQYMMFERNPEYWDAENVRTDRIRMAFVGNYNTSLNFYEAGEFDYQGNNMSLPSELKRHLSQYKDYHAFPWLTVYHYWINTQVKPLDDPRVRMALKLAVDREAITQHVTQGGEIPYADTVPDGLAGYRGLGSPIFAPERARQLLAEAGYPGGKGFPRLTVIYNTSEGHKQIAEATQQMWKANLGIDVRLENQEWKVFLKNLQQKDFQIARFGWIGDYPDPYTFLELFLSTNGNNHSNWKSHAYDAAINEANAERDPKVRLAKLREAERMVWEATPLIPFYVYSRTEMYKPYFMGHWGNYMNQSPFKYWWIDERWYQGVPTEPADNTPPPLLLPDPAPVVSQSQATSPAGSHAATTEESP